MLRWKLYQTVLCHDKANFFLSLSLLLLSLESFQALYVRDEPQNVSRNMHYTYIYTNYFLRLYTTKYVQV